MGSSFDNRALENAMRAVASADSPENRNKLYAAMLETSFLVPTETTPAAPASPPAAGTEAGTAAGDAAIVVCVAGEQQVAPVFTHPDALQSWDENVPWIVLRGIELFKRVLDTHADEIAINPFEPDKKIGLVRPGGRVTHWEIAALAQGKSPQDRAQTVTDQPQQFLLSTPAQMPKEFFAALIGAAKKHTVVLAMTFSQISDQKGQSYRAVAVEFAPDASTKAKDSAIASFSDALQPLIGDEETVEFFGTSTAMGAEIVEIGKKFYG